MLKVGIVGGGLVLFIAALGFGIAFFGESPMPPQEESSPAIGLEEPPAVPSGEPAFATEERTEPEPQPEPPQPPQPPPAPKEADAQAVPAAIPPPSPTPKAALLPAGITLPDLSHLKNRTYAKTIARNEPLVLSGNDVLEINDTHYIISNNVRLSDNAVLIIRNSLFEHRKDYTFQFSLEARGNSRVIVENSAIANSCTGSLNWNFFDNSRMETNGVEQEDCNIWHLFTDSSSAKIRSHRFNGTFCEKSSGDIENGIDMELELCWKESSVVDEELPLEIKSFVFPNENDKNINFNLAVRNSTVDGWGIGVQPNTDITIRNSPRITVSIIIGWPYENRTAVLQDLVSKKYDDYTWQIVDSKLRLVNSATYGWEPNAFCCNTVIVRNSDYAASNINGGKAEYVIENSTVGDLGAQEEVKMTVRNSRVKGNVVARGNSVITLISTIVEGKTVEEGSGKVIVQ